MQITFTSDDGTVLKSISCEDRTVATDAEARDNCEDEIKDAFWESVTEIRDARSKAIQDRVKRLVKEKKLALPKPTKRA